MQWVKKEIEEEIKNFLKFNENDHIPKFMGHNESSVKRKVHSTKYLHKEAGKFHTSELTEHLKTLEQKEANSPKKTRIIKLRAEINKIETKKTIQRINETKSWFFDKINKIDKPLSKLTKKQRENIQINKIINEKGDITTDIEEIERINTSYFENLYPIKLENLKEMDNILDKY